MVVKNLTNNKPTDTFYVYRDSYGDIKLVHSEKTAAQYARNGKYATVKLPAEERFTAFREKLFMEAFNHIDCLK